MAPCIIFEEGGRSCRETVLLLLGWPENETLGHGRLQSSTSSMQCPTLCKACRKKQHSNPMVYTFLMLTCSKQPSDQILRSCKGEGILKHRKLRAGVAPASGPDGLEAWNAGSKTSVGLTLSKCRGLNSQKHHPYS